METTAVIERVERIGATRADVTAGRTGLEGVLRDVTALRGWLSAVEADVTGRLAQQVSFPEAAIAESTRTGLADAGRTLERSRTLDAAPDLASALDGGSITSQHIDAVTRAAAGLNPGQRAELIERCDALSPVAQVASVEQWGRRIRDEARRVQTADGLAVLERQRRATRLSTWVDNDGMWNLRGRFDPVTGVKLAAKLDTAVEALFAKQTPDTAPTDPIERQHHLRALALADLLDGAGGGVPGRAEFVAVIDADAPATPGSTGPVVEWSIPVEIPAHVLAELVGDADVHAVVVRNGVVLHAPGQLDQGRSTRLANRAQRRALRGLYRTCAIPGCAVHYDRCHLHHIIWWRNGGTTDLANLLPVCTKHHGRIHHDGWTITLGPNRELTLTLPDGTKHSTGPPGRQTAA
jgi:hypothetical protein